MATQHVDAALTPTALQPLLATVLEAPHEDAPRLAYARALSEHAGGTRAERAARKTRAEFIRSQVGWARRGRGYEPGNGCRTGREFDLVDQYSDAWTGGPHAEGVELRYHRGFVGWVMTPPAGFADSFPRLVRAEPVRTVSLYAPDEDPGREPLPEGWLDPVVGVPELSRVWSIDLRNRNVTEHHVRQLLSCPRFAAERLTVSFTGFLTPRVFGVLADSPGATRLRLLDVSQLGCAAINDKSPAHFKDLWADAVAALAESPHLRGLSQLYLSGNALPPEAATVLAAADWRLEALDLDGSRFGSAGAVVLSTSDRFADLGVLGLARCKIGDDGAEALARSTHLPRLADLDLSGNRITDRGALLLAESPPLAGLRRLNLEGNHIGQRGVTALCTKFGDRVSVL
jgi:uncharacterized protein (TIGR02996 family)